jgi:hypothetical protein
MILRSRDSSRLVSRLLRRKSAATNHYSISQPSMLQTYKIPKDRNENEAQPGERPDNDKERSETSRDTSIVRPELYLHTRTHNKYEFQLLGNRLSMTWTSAESASNGIGARRLTLRHAAYDSTRLESVSIFPLLSEDSPACDRAKT